MQTLALSRFELYPEYMATIKDVAQLAGVNPSTVSRVFNGTAKISSRTIDLVRDAAHKLGYRPNKTASALASRRSPVELTAVVVPRLDHPFFQRVLAGIHRELARHTVGIVVAALEPDPAFAWELLRRLDPAGVICLSLRPDQLKDIGKRRVVLADFRGELNAVYVDHYAGGRMAARYLQKRGVRLPLLLWDRVPTPGLSERREGFLSVWKGPVRELWAPQNRKQAIAVLEKSRVASEADGFFCYCDEMAFGVLEWQRRRKTNLPLVGYDDHPEAAAYGLTTVAQPAVQMGEVAAQLVRRLEEFQEHRGPSVRLNPRLIVRAT